MIFIARFHVYMFARRHPVPGWQLRNVLRKMIVTKWWNIVLIDEVSFATCNTNVDLSNLFSLTQLNGCLYENNYNV